MASSLAARALLGLIKVYRYTLSPLIGRQCRYLPTCSHYAEDALRAHGAWAGSWMALARVCRCRPWGGSGYDPAPAETRGRWWKPWTYGVWRYSSPVNGGGGREADGGGDHIGDRSARASVVAPSVSLRSTAPPRAGEQLQRNKCHSH